MFGKIRVKKANKLMTKAEDLIATGDTKKIFKGLQYAKKAITTFPVEQKFASDWDKMKGRSETLSEMIEARLGD